MKLPKETSKEVIALHGSWYGDACGTAFGMELIGERWALLIVRELMFGPLRFSDIRANLPGISAKVLTQRLEKLEQAGALVRRTLPPPAASQVYELTQWGYRAEPIVQELGRWAAMSVDHDPTLPLSPASFMLSLRTMFDPEKALGFSADIGFRIADTPFVANLNDGALPVHKREEAAVDARFISPSGAPALAAHFYGGVSAKDAGIVIEGDAAMAARFADLFELPAKLNARS
jgi:DNA-binding HxlR family transcriptional regulator